MATLIEFGKQIIDLLLPLLNKFVVAIIIILIGFIIGRILGKFLEKLLYEIELNKLIKEATGIKFSLAEIVGMIVKYLTYFIFIVIALNQIGITTIVLNMITGAVFILLILAIFLGIKDFIPNFIAGLSIISRGNIKKGDLIQVNSTKGRIQNISLMQTLVKTSKGDIIFLPNSLLTKHKVIKLEEVVIYSIVVPILLIY